MLQPSKIPAPPPLVRLHKTVRFLVDTVGFVRDFLIMFGASVEAMYLKQQADKLRARTAGDSEPDDEDTDEDAPGPVGPEPVWYGPPEKFGAYALCPISWTGSRYIVGDPGKEPN